MSELERFTEYLRSRWDSEGSCNSCGWHAAMYEHGPFELPDADDISQGYVRFTCVSDDDEESYTHRGVRISLDGWQPRDQETARHE